MKRSHGALAALATLVPVALLAQEAPSSFPTMPEPSPQVIRTICGSGPTRGVTVLRNGTSQVGGYVAVPRIMDSPISFHDANGKFLTLFHIFGSDESKRQASAIVNKLKAEFPREEFLACDQPRG